MSLSNNSQNLIKAVIQNDLRQAKKCALACIEEDTTQKNKWFCNKYRQILESSGGNMIELPSELKGIVNVEDVSISFKENRYYLSDRENKIYDSIIRMKKVSEKLMEMGIKYTNSTLLYGESGTGKTTFGRYVAFKTGLPFCYINFANLVSSYMGSTSKNISKAFQYAISSPCVFMLDEVDCISINRSSAGNGPDEEMSRVTISLMQEFDKLTNDIIVIGATNREDRIDAALLRRFTQKHEVKKLNREERVDLIKKFISDVGIDFSDIEMRGMADEYENQSQLLYELVRRIAEKIESEVA